MNRIFKLTIFSAISLSSVAVMYPMLSQATRAPGRATLEYKSADRQNASVIGQGSAAYQPWYKRWFNTFTQAVYRTFYKTDSSLLYSEEEMAYEPVDLSTFPKTKQALEQEKAQLIQTIANERRLYNEWYEREKEQADDSVDFEKRATRVYSQLTRKSRRLGSIKILLDEKTLSPSEVQRLNYQKDELKIRLAELRRKEKLFEESKDELAKILNAEDIGSIVYILQAIDLQLLKALKE